MLRIRAITLAVCPGDNQTTLTSCTKANTPFHQSLSPAGAGWFLPCLSFVQLGLSLESSVFVYARARSTQLKTSGEGGSKREVDGNETHTVLYHEEGNSSVFVGAIEKLYYYDFDTQENYTVRFTTQSSHQFQWNPYNYLTFLEKYNDKLLICGTNACQPTCWNWVNRKKERTIVARGLAPFVPEQNTLVLVDGKEIYSTIKKHLNNGKIPRFRRIHGSGELYTSDTVMQNPQFIKATIIKQTESYNDRIYYFFREDNPDQSAGAPLNVSRVAQLCKGDRGGVGSLSAAKWTTFLKATLVCTDPATNRNFNWLQDVFVVHSNTNWQETKIYGLFSNPWGYSAVCIYSIGNIDKVFRTSPLKGYNGDFHTIRPGQCLQGDALTPTETFKVVDSHPEVVEKVKPQVPLFHNKYRYQKIGVHRVQAADGHTYNVLYLTTDKGTIHKMVELPDCVVNIMEILPFQPQVPIHTMTLDNERVRKNSGTTSLLMSCMWSLNEVVRVPMAMCGVYRNNCESCLLARDPYCGWANGKCRSIYDYDHLGDGYSFQNVTVMPFSRYYLSCPMESHHAAYTWIHNDHIIKRCESNHRHCLHFIDNVTDECYGTYACFSQESYFNQTVMVECLVKPPETAAVRMASSQATIPFSFWLPSLYMVVFCLLLQ
uniref:Semaphorin 7A (JohnMiltonHagen blood group) n=1 Tax=Sphenodon punctatus TaxID=8508 RepID=A0A8D0GV17_SPHPU